MMRLLQNTFRVSFEVKDDLRILEVCVLIEMTCKGQIKLLSSFTLISRNEMV